MPARGPDPGDVLWAIVAADLRGRAIATSADVSWDVDGPRPLRHRPEASFEVRGLLQGWTDPVPPARASELRVLEELVRRHPEHTRGLLAVWEVESDPAGPPPTPAPAPTPEPPAPRALDDTEARFSMLELD